MVNTLHTLSQPLGIVGLAMRAGVRLEYCLQLSHLSIVGIVLRDEFHAVAITLAVADKALENQ